MLIVSLTNCDDETWNCYGKKIESGKCNSIEIFNALDYGFSHFVSHLSFNDRK